MFFGSGGCLDHDIHQRTASLSRVLILVAVGGGLLGAVLGLVVLVLALVAGGFDFVGLRGGGATGLHLAALFGGFLLFLAVAGGAVLLIDVI